MKTYLCPTRVSKLCVLIFTLSGLILHSGCAILKPKPDITRYYTLVSDHVANLNNGESAGLSLGIRQIELPGYLETPRIVTRYKEYELDYSERHRWAEPIDQSVGRLLRNSLESAEAIDSVSTFPWPEPPAYDYTIKIKIRRFEGVEASSSLLQAQWAILEGNTNKALVESQTNVTLRWDGTDYAAFAKAMSASCEQLIDEIETALEGQIHEGE